MHRDINTCLIDTIGCCLPKIEAMARIGHWHWEFTSGRSHASPELCRILGQPPDWRPSPDDVLDLLADEERDAVRDLLRRALGNRQSGFAFACRARNGGGDGSPHLQVQASFDRDADGTPLRLLLIAQDVSELKSYEAQLHEMSFRDTITGLPNRALFNDRLRQSIVEATRRDKALGLLVLDIDRFKEINDTHGHAVGDRLLYESAERLRGLVRDYDTVARLGGDEFALVLPELRDAADLGNIASKMLDALARPFRIGDQDLFVTASIGIAAFPSDGDTPADLLRYAGLALHDTKKRGRAGFRFYAADLTAKSRARAEMEAALRRAEPDGALELHFQPKIDLANGALVGAEALLRWHHPVHGMVPPDRFIGIAEDSGLIVGIGAWVLSKACLAAQRWNASGGGSLKVAVNLSPRQFAHDDILETVKSALSLTGCEPRWLELEITESLLLDDDDGVRATLLALRNLGISIAIDDFGTGYSALGYLKRFPIDVLKIDRSFIRDVMIDPDSAELTKAIIHMGRSLNLDLVAEGIETEAQERFLRANGCHLGQGYRFGKPVPLVDFEAIPAMDRHPSQPFNRIRPAA